ncbi:MAG: protein kinase [Candidatus Eremiobacterota bacterium]
MIDTVRLCKGSILDGKYKINEILSDETEENDIKYIASHIHNPDKHLLIRELVFSINDEKFKKDIIGACEERLKKIIKIRHLNLSPVFDVFSREEKEFLTYRIYIVTEAENYGRRNLAHVMKEYREDIPVDKIKEWALQICEALSSLHNSEEGPVIFYDLKPEHILFSDDGRIKLTDYGVSRMLEKGFYSNRYMGTPGYSAPEQYSLKPVDTRVDVFALGALLHYLITKEDPRNNPLKFSPLRGKKELGDIVTGATEFNHDKRIQKIDEVKELLDKISAEQAQKSIVIKKKQKIEEERPDIKAVSCFEECCSYISWNMKKFWYANMNQLLATGTVFVLSLIVAGILMAGSRECKNKRVIIIGENGPEIVSIDIQKPENLEIFKTKYKLRGESLLSRNGKYIYIASSPDLLCCFDLEKNQMVSQIKVGNDPHGMSFSPVQNYLAVTGSATDTITLIDTDYNNVVATLKSGGKYPVAVCFSSTGKELFVINRDSMTLNIMEITGNITGSIKIDGYPVDMLNPGFNNKLYVSIGDKNEILLIDTDKKQIISHIKLPDSPGKMSFSKDKNLLAIACQKTYEIILLSLIDDKVSDKIKFQNIPSSMTFSDCGKYLYVGTTTFDHAMNYIYLWDLETRNSRKFANSAFTAMSLIFVSSALK